MIEGLKQLLRTAEPGEVLQLQHNIETILNAGQHGNDDASCEILDRIFSADIPWIKDFRPPQG
jgi:succinylglutamate desuccinylase